MDAELRTLITEAIVSGDFSKVPLCPNGDDDDLLMESMNPTKRDLANAIAHLQIGLDREERITIANGLAFSLASRAYGSGNPHSRFTLADAARIADAIGSLL